MPYINEMASKVSHSDFLKNEEIQNFLDKCDYIEVPSEDAEEIKDKFITPEIDTKKSLPENIISVDGSYYESSINNKLPSTKIGYVKIGSLLIKTNKFAEIDKTKGKYLDPFEIAKLKNKNNANTFVLPSSNIILGDKENVRDSFREMVDQYLYNHRTNEEDPDTSLRTTLFHLASMRSGELGTNNKNLLKIHKCPNCENEELEVKNISKKQFCKACGSQIYPSDCLRIWEEVSNNQSNRGALSRFMLVLEHLIPVHYLRIVSELSLESISNTGFVIDGPLAMFGNAAWLHATILKYINNINEKLRENNFPEVLYMGLQKTGHIMDYANIIIDFIDSNSLLAIDDKFRYEYIIKNRDPSSSFFGSETYYGQDFIYKSSSNRIFTFSLPYPFKSKSQMAKKDFLEEKVKYENYSRLNSALKLIKEFECDLYENSIIPIALAHRYTSISLEPGSRVLDLLTKETLKSKNEE
ncbi:MAG: hypothetical protein ACOCRX_05360 [Candidatus Woesearchaeota archaeon]